MIKLGLEAKDKVTGFEGVVVSRHQHIIGCDQYQIQPYANKNRKFPDSCFFDEDRLKVLDNEIRGPQPDAPAR